MQSKIFLKIYKNTELIHLKILLNTYSLLDMFFKHWDYKFVCFLLSFGVVILINIIFKFFFSILK